MEPQGDNAISKIRTREDFAGQTTWFIQQQETNVQEKKIIKRKQDREPIEEKRFKRFGS